MFSGLQYWGIGITVVTFALDIYLTITGNGETAATPQVKQEDNSNAPSETTGDQIPSLVPPGSVNSSNRTT